MATCSMLEDEAMKDYIAWCKVEDSDGLSISDIEAFAENALPKYFPDMNKVHIANSQPADNLISLLCFSIGAAFRNSSVIMDIGSKEG